MAKTIFTEEISSEDEIKTIEKALFRLRKEGPKGKYWKCFVVLNAKGEVVAAEKVSQNIQFVEEESLGLEFLKKVKKETGNSYLLLVKISNEAAFQIYDEEGS